MSSSSDNVRKGNDVVTSDSPKYIGLFAQAIKAKDTVYASGNIGFDPKTNKMIDSSIEGQTAQTLRNLKAVLEAAGSSFGKVVKLNIYLSDIRNFEAMNEVYAPWFEEPRPARTCVQVAALPFQALVEMEAVALL